MLIPDSSELTYDDEDRAISPLFDLGYKDIDDVPHPVHMVVSASRYTSGTLYLEVSVLHDNGFLDYYDHVTTTIDGPLFLLSDTYDVIVSDKCSRSVYEWLISAGLLEPDPYTQTRRHSGADLSYIHQLTDEGIEFIDLMDRAETYNDAGASDRTPWWQIR